MSISRTLPKAGLRPWSSPAPTRRARAPSFRCRRAWPGWARLLAHPGPIACAALVVLGIAAGPARAQLPPAPTPVPGSLLDRPASAPDVADETVLPDGVDPPAGGYPDPAAGQRRRITVGTAFRVSGAGHLITSRHLVEGCRAIGVIVGNKAVGGLRVVAADPQHDIALLSGPPDAQAAILRRGGEVAQGEDVLSYGYPLPGVLSSAGQLGAGMVTASSGIRNDPAQLQVDVPLQRGNSGGPLLDRRGHVVGVVFAKLDALRIARLTGDLPQNVNFAVRIGPVKRLLESQGVAYAEGEPGDPVQDNQQIAARAREWTLPIACQREAAAR